MPSEFIIDYTYYTSLSQCNQVINIQRSNETTFVIRYKKKLLRYETNNTHLLNDISFKISKLSNVFSFVKSKLNKITTMDLIDDFNISFVIFDGVKNNIIYNQHFEYTYIINLLKYKSTDFKKLTKLYKLMYAFDFLDKETRSSLYLFNNTNFERDINLIKKTIISSTDNIITRKLPRELIENILDNF